MALNYLTPSQIAQQYLLQLKTLKPEINKDQTDSDWWVRGQVLGGVFSGIYADQKRISNDAFPQSARHDALLNHLNLYFNSGFITAQPAVGSVQVPGASGTTVNFGLQFLYPPNGNLYSATSTVAFGAATSAIVPVQSVNTGQAQNLLQGAVLSIPSPTAGLGNTAVVVNGNISDGRDDETDPEASSRILLQVRTPLAGGKTADYQAFALAADPSVVSASVIRYPFGFGTVGVVITAGTTDVDTALNSGQAIVVVPSAALVATVQAYIETQNPVTDCATVFPAASVAQDVTVTVRFVSGDQTTLVTDSLGNTLSQGALVQREVQRAIYKTPAGGRILGGKGYVVASEIEEVIDIGLASTFYDVGLYAQILSDRQVANLSATGANRLLASNQVAVPGVITVNVST